MTRFEAMEATMASSSSGATRVAVVTGGTAGVGRATVRELAAKGYDVAALARGDDRLDATAADIRSAGRRALALSVDVADPDAVEAAAGIVEDRLGPIDVWINNAFVGALAPVWEMSPEEFRRITEVTYLGQVHGTMAALRRMRPRNAGVLVQVGSALAYRGIPLQSAYCGAKHAIVGFTESVRTELMHEKSRVRISMVHLPALNTPQFDWVLNRMPDHPQPVPPIYQPEVAARGIVHMAEHPRREMWIGAPTVGTILANRLVPGLLDRYLGRTGFASQQAKQKPTESMTGPNLFEPAPGDQGAHGSFDAKAHAGSVELSIAKLGGKAVAMAAAGVGAAAAAAVARRR
jgi:NAD(P)-dependent dehydrogenase (short-subunit alcohol dehydrogenase family)